jgi:hypothetical protein
MTIAGPEEGVAFRAARGAGVIPWHFDLDRIEEDCFHLLVFPLASAISPTCCAPLGGVVAGQRRAASIAPAARRLARRQQVGRVPAHH